MVYSCLRDSVNAEKTIDINSSMNGMVSQQPIILMMGTEMIKNGASSICRTPVILYKCIG
jgi:hypothetical protein